MWKERNVIKIEWSDDKDWPRKRRNHDLKISVDMKMKSQASRNHLLAEDNEQSSKSSEPGCAAPADKE